MADPIAMAIGELVVRNREQPAAERSRPTAILEAMQTGVGIDEDLTRSVLGVMVVMQTDGAIAQHRVPVAQKEQGKVVRVTPGGGHQGYVIRTGTRWDPCRLALS